MVQTVGSVNLLTRNSYQNYLISRLKDPEYAALYLEAHLEETEDIELELLQLALDNVLQALSVTRLTADETAVHRQKLDEILALPGSLAIYGLANWLQELGLKLTVTVADETKAE